MRLIGAVVLNIVAPGAGLLALGRPRTGLLLAVLYVLCAEVVLCGVLIAPHGMPTWLVVGAGVLTLATWLLGQWMLKDRVATLRDPALRHELETLRSEALAAIERRDLAEAQAILRIALTIDPDCVETLVLSARLSSLLGKLHAARRTWRQVARSGDDRFVREAEHALRQLTT